ncbi:MAG TPA: hypothetical protein VFX60_16925, partial [Micromonospora sp.]|nr:hypothetical protein [Micromonospora sp.]
EASFTEIWRFTDVWERVSAEGRPSGFNAAAPVNGGVLVVTGPNGSGVIADGRYQDLGWPLAGNEIRVLDDDSLLIVHHDNSIWLGEGRQAERRWIKIVLERG